MEAETLKDEIRKIVRKHIWTVTPEQSEQIAQDIVQKMDELKREDIVFKKKID